MRNPSNCQYSPSSKGYCRHSVSQKISRVFLKFWGSNWSQIFKKYILKEWFWNCLCPSVREKSGIHSHNFFPPEASLPALVGGVDRFSTEAFLPWSDLICPLLMQAPYSSLPVLPLRWGGDAPGVDLMSSQSDLFPYHQGLWFHLSFSFDATQGVTVVSWNNSQAGTARGSIHFMCAYAHSWE